MWEAAGLFVAAGALLGGLRGAMPKQRRVFDAVCVCAALLPLAASLAA